MTSRYLLPFFHQFHITVRSLYNRPTMLFWRNMDSTVAGNIETMSLEMKIWQWIRDIYYEWMIIKQLLCLCRLHWYVLPYSPMIWCYDKVVRQKRSHATSRHSFITTVWWYNILYQTPCIRQVTFFNFKGKHT